MTATTAPLTAKQQAILAYIVEHTSAASPTFRQIAEHFRFKSRNAVSVHVNALVKKGVLRRTGNGPRNLEVVE